MTVHGVVEVAAGIGLVVAHVQATAGQGDKAQPGRAIVLIVEDADRPRALLFCAGGELRREAVDGYDQGRAGGGDLVGDGGVIGGVDGLHPQVAFFLRQVPVAGDQVAVAAGRHGAQFGGIAVQIDHQARDGGDDGRGRQRAAQTAGERIGADIHRDMIIEQRERDAQINAGRHSGRRVIGDQQQIGGAGQDFGQTHCCRHSPLAGQKKGPVASHRALGGILGRMKPIITGQ